MIAYSHMHKDRQMTMKMSLNLKKIWSLEKNFGVFGNNPIPIPNLRIEFPNTPLL